MQQPSFIIHENNYQPLKASSKTIGVCELCGLDSILFDYFGKQCCNSCNVDFMNSINKKYKINCKHLNKIVGSRCNKCRYFKNLDSGMAYTDKKLSCELCVHEQAFIAYKNVFCCLACKAFIIAKSKKNELKPSTCSHNHQCDALDKIRKCRSCRLNKFETLAKDNKNTNENIK